ENGNGTSTDWHGFTKDRVPVGILGTAAEPPFPVVWDLGMVPDQDAVAVRAVVRLKERPGLCYETPAVRVAMPRARDAAARPEALRGRSVELLYAEEVPRPFWSRAGRRQRCVIRLPYDPALLQRAELHVVIWDGGRGNVAEPFTLNGHPLTVAGEGRHDVLYRVVPLQPTMLRQGENEIAVLSDTEHHGIEVLSPGPALVIRR
ncbi:MAG: hypothetical protein QHJ73_19920, partial [Armatimonadota bacterium]|nr:hypothetical protein [Armatimonadota bacterium]